MLKHTHLQRWPYHTLYWFAFHWGTPWGRHGHTSWILPSVSTVGIFRPLTFSWTPPVKIRFLLAEKFYVGLFLFFSISPKLLPISFRYQFITSEDGYLYNVIVCTIHDREGTIYLLRLSSKCCLYQRWPGFCRPFKVWGDVFKMLKIFLYTCLIERWYEFNLPGKVKIVLPFVSWTFLAFSTSASILVFFYLCFGLFHFGFDFGIF